MVEKRVTRKELLKTPDEFMTSTGRMIEFARENPRHTLYAAVAVLALIVGVIGFYSYQRHQDSASHQLFDRALVAYQAFDSAEKSVKPEEWNKLLPIFTEIADSYSSYPAGEMARLYAGHVQYKQGEFKPALESYLRLKNSTLEKQGFGPLILYHMAMTRFALKEYEAAGALFDQLSKDTGSPYRREAFAAIARIYESMGKNKEAAQAYRQYLKMFPEAPDAPFMRARLAALSAQG